MFGLFNHLWGHLVKTFKHCSEVCNRLILVCLFHLCEKYRPWHITPY